MALPRWGSSFATRCSPATVLSCRLYGAPYSELVPGTPAVSVDHVCSNGFRASLPFTHACQLVEAVAILARPALPCAEEAALVAAPSHDSGCDSA